MLFVRTIIILKFLFIGIIFAQTNSNNLSSEENDSLNEKNCKALCAHCGCLGFYCGEECICETNDDNSENVECVSLMQSNCRKLKLPFEVLIQGPSSNSFMRSAMRFDQTINSKEWQKTMKMTEGRNKRNTVVIYKPGVAIKMPKIPINVTQRMKRDLNGIVAKFLKFNRKNSDALQKRDLKSISKGLKEKRSKSVTQSKIVTKRPSPFSSNLLKKKGSNLSSKRTKKTENSLLKTNKKSSSLSKSKSLLKGLKRRDTDIMNFQSLTKPAPLKMPTEDISTQSANPFSLEDDDAWFDDSAVQTKTSTPKSQSITISTKNYTPIPSHRPSILNRFLRTRRSRSEVKINSESSPSPNSYVQLQQIENIIKKLKEAVENLKVKVRTKQQQAKTSWKLNVIPPLAIRDENNLRPHRSSINNRGNQNEFSEDLDDDTSNGMHMKNSIDSNSNPEDDEYFT